MQRTQGWDKKESIDTFGFSWWLLSSLRYKYADKYEKSVQAVKYNGEYR